MRNINQPQAAAQVFVTRNPKVNPQRNRRAIERVTQAESGTQCPEDPDGNI